MRGEKTTPLPPKKVSSKHPQLSTDTVTGTLGEVTPVLRLPAGGGVRGAFGTEGLPLVPSSLDPVDVPVRPGKVPIHLWIIGHCLGKGGFYRSHQRQRTLVLRLTTLCGKVSENEPDLTHR